MITWTKAEDDFIKSVHAKQIYTWKQIYEMYCDRFGNSRSFYGFKSHASGRLKLRLKDRHSHNSFSAGVVTAQVGTMRKINGYWMTKVCDEVGKKGSHDAYRKNWKFTHRIVWEQNNGSIPDGYAVMFLDGNHDNLSISNLIAVPIAIQGRVRACEDPQLTLLAIKAAELDIAIKEAWKEYEDDTDQEHGEAK